MGQEQYTLLIGMAIGSTVGLFAGWVFYKARFFAALRDIVSLKEVEIVRLNEKLAAANSDIFSKSSEIKQGNALAEQLRAQVSQALSENAQLSERASRVPVLEQQLQGKDGELATAREQIKTLSEEIAGLTTKLEEEVKQAAEKLALLDEAKTQLTDQFKVLANEILEDKSKKFTEQNQQNLNQLIEPLKTKISEFQGKVEEVYVQEGKDRTALAEQVRQMMQLNHQLSEDTMSLTKALKGQAKSRGNWGELILERVLEASGLRQGHEYDVQDSHTREDGSRAQPDVVIRLPENRHLVIDAKVSLNAYDDYVNAEDEAKAAAALKRHMDSVKAHIKGLSEKNYQQLYDLQSLDFVLMFVPIEPAFMLAIAHDSELWQDAWNKNVLLVSPSTLLFVVRTVAHLWRQEQQNRNAQEIANRGAELFDKLVGFVEEMDTMGNRLKQAQDSYDSAYKKLSHGRGNVIRQAEMLKALGVKPSKALPETIVDLALDDSLADGLE